MRSRLLSRPRRWGVPHGAATILLDRVRVTAGQGASAAGVALRFKENAAGRGGYVASGREEGAGGCVGEGAVPGEAEHTVKGGATG